jgi:uncharacterized protein YkwD
MAKGRKTKRITTALAVLGVGVAAAACGPSATSGPPACAAPAYPPGAVTSTILNRTNGQRAAGGVGGLSWNPQLYCLALDWSTQLGQSGTFHHRDLNSVINSAGYRGYHTLGENILRGSASMDGNSMHDAWMRSPEHAANIMSASYSSIGIGLYYTPGGQVYATQNFGG